MKKGIVSENFMSVHTHFCRAFFRRSVSTADVFLCVTGRNNCKISLKVRLLCILFKLSFGAVPNLAGSETQPNYPNLN